MTDLLKNLGNWRPSFHSPRTELPEFTRCCCCLPLRQGLLVWGYFKMVGLLVLAYAMFTELSRFLERDYGVPVMLAIVLAMLLIDIVFNLEFIVAGHLKHQQLFQVYYYYSIAFLSLYTVTFLAFIIWNFYDFYSYSFHFVLWLTIEILSTFVPILCIQGYVTLLVRSELKKLNDGSNFRFINNAAEAACSLDMSVPDTKHLTMGIEES